VDPRDATKVFAAVWYQAPGAGGGVFESIDAGKTWKLMGLDSEAVRALEMAPSKPEQLVAGTRTGVFLSADAGKNWKQISPAGDEELKNLDSLAIDPRDPLVIYAGTYHLPWLTRDGGKTWKSVIAGIIDDSDIMSLRLDAANPDRVYMSACSGIYRSENQGGEWVKLQGIPYAARRTQVIVQDAANPKTLYAGTTAGLWVTRDGGENWARTTSKDWVINSITILPGKDGVSGRVIMGTEGQGVLTSDDAGATFAEANHGFTHVIVRQLIADTRDPLHLAMIVDRGTPEILESHDEGKSWTNIPWNTWEKGKRSLVSANLVQEIFPTPWGWLVRFEDGRLWRWDGTKQAWIEWLLRLPAVQPKSPGGVPKNAVRPAAPVRLLAEEQIVFSQKDAFVSTKEGFLRCQDSGSCVRMKPFGRGTKVRAVWVSPVGSDIAIVMDGKFGWSLDAGETAKWRDLPVSGEQVLWLDVAESHAERTFFLGTDLGLFISKEGSDWQKITGGLPSGQVDRWLHTPAFWAASERDGGLYLSQDSGSSWKRADRDADRGRFTGFIPMQDGGLLAGSQSEGLLGLKLEKPPAVSVQ
ncbi:MAG TPA: hypothetical protein VMH89_07860, partial [Candidatus Acidoferrum sp.]|nr:hypothetical protein [Candidatus Acidoferrum sp.]